ncbi:MAG: xanthine dehydrogenase family protein molybdopterin-binding subunit, partial [Elioraea sp.]|nr:xanthine dehydrogenase family protein molybdopterin-binding subunit [Elioraea sp.]
MKFGLSQPMRRVEDPRLLRGSGLYADDLALPGQTYGVVVRSPHANARIRAIDTAAAKAVAGVLAVFTGADFAAAGLGPVPCAIPLRNRDGTPRAALAVDRVRYVGDPVAFVVAETPKAAKDGAEAVLVDYEPLPAVTDLAAANQPGAPLV